MVRSRLASSCFIPCERCGIVVGLGRQGKAQRRVKVTYKSKGIPGVEEERESQPRVLSVLSCYDYSTTRRRKVSGRAM